MTLADWKELSTVCSGANLGGFQCYVTRVVQQYSWQVFAYDRKIAEGWAPEQYTAKAAVHDLLGDIIRATAEIKT